MPGVLIKILLVAALVWSSSADYEGAPMSTRKISDYFKGVSGVPPAGARVDIELGDNGIGVLAVPSIALSVAAGTINSTTGYWEADVIDSTTSTKPIRVRESVNGHPVRTESYEIPSGATTLPLYTLTPVEPALPYTNRLTHEGHVLDPASPYYSHPNLQAQIDELAAGSTDGATEVAQAHVDSFAVTYATLKARIDAADSVTQSGTGAVARRVKTKLSEWYSVKDFGAVGDGVTDDTAAIQAAANTGKPLHFPYGTYVVSSPVTISASLRGDGADDNQTTFLLTGTGQLVVGDEHAVWDNIKVVSEVNSLTFIKCSVSYWTFRNFRLEKIGAASSQVGIEFDTTPRSVYFADVHDFKIKLDYPVKITGNGAESFNANRIGASLRDYWQAFVSAVTVSSGSVMACVANEFAGYMETGTNAFVIDDGPFRENRIDLILDMVTRLINPSIAVNEPNFWRLKSSTIAIGGGAGVVSNQIWQGDKARFRAYRAGGNQGLNDATWTKLALDTVNYDETGDFNTTTYQFTARYPMKLLVTAMAAVNANLADQDEVRIAIYKNAAEVARSTHYLSGSAGVSAQVSDVVELAAGDTVSVWAWANEAAGANTHLVTSGTTVSYFAGVEL